MRANNRNPQGSGHLYYNKERKMYIYRIPNGKKTAKGNTSYTTFSGKTKKEAMQAGLQFLAITTPSTNSENILLKDYILNWYQVYKKGSNRLKGQSVQAIYNTITLHIIPLIGNFYLSQLTPELLQKYFVGQLLATKSQKTGNYISFSTFNKAWIYLNECLEFATNMGHIQKNPMKILQKPKKDIIEQKNEELRCFTKRELQNFVTAIYETQEDGNKLFEKGDMLLIYLHTGMRASELIGMRKKNVDLEKRKMNICENYVHYYNSEEKITISRNSSPKTASSFRTVFLDDVAYEIVKKYYNKGSMSKEAYLLSGDIDKPVSYNVLVKLFKRICKYAEITKPGGLHTLRHTLASTMYANGEDTKMISNILGHSRTSITEDIYIHIANEQKNEVMSRIPDLLGASEKTGNNGNITSFGGMDVSELTSVISMKDLIETKENIEKIVQTIPEDKIIYFLSNIISKK